MRHLLLFLYPFLTLTLFAQNSNMPDLHGWLDDEHYLIARDGEDGKEQLIKVAVRSGKESAYEKEQTIRDMIPSDVSASRFNSIESTNGEKLVINKSNDLYLFAKRENKVRKITANQQEEKNSAFSPNGRYVAFTRDYNLYTLDTETGLEQQLTNDGGGLIYNGYASWVYYEEILGRGSRYSAFWWSPDSKKIAFLRFDDSTVPEFPIFHFDKGVHGDLQLTRYPKPGDPNPLVKLGIVHLDSGEIIWVEEDADKDQYTAWPFWTPDSKQLFFQQLNRDQDTLDILSANPETGEVNSIYSEIQPTWVEFFEEIHFLNNNKGFLLRSNKDGWYNLYHYSMNGKLVKKVTDVDWRITGIEKIDEEKGKIFFRGTGPVNTESHFFVTDIKSGKVTQLTKRSGSHRIDLSPGGSYFIDHFSSYDTPSIVELFHGNGKLVRNLGSNEKNANEENGLKVEFFTIPSGDGFDLPAYWVLPPDFDKSKKYPVIFSIYGGPDAGQVRNSYRNYSYSNVIKEGAIQFCVDHRGSGKFGKKGVDYMHRNLGKWEMHDYIAAAKWLKEKPFIDSERIGITGYSYGGYATALALTYGAEHFTHGFAGGPVTDWRLYDNVYTERYMDTPESNPEGYDYGSVMTYAEKLKGKLVLIHGVIDDNVHMQNTLQLVSKFQDLGKEFQLQMYPGQLHGIRGTKGRHYSQTRNRFWTEEFFNQK